MKCKVIRAFGQYSVGAVIDPPGIYRQQLQARGFIEPLPVKAESPVVVERAVQPVETAVAVATKPARTRKPRG